MILDTSVCVDLLREQVAGTEGPATRKLLALGATAVQLTVFTMCELEAGASSSANPRRERERIAVFASRRSVISPDERFARLYGQAHSALRRAGTPVPVMDLLIGVCALQSGQPLLTRDPVHFGKIPGLTVETY
jgi:predicted nucleic acid-binding protein